MEKEIWKTIEDYSNYQVSNMGRVKSLNYKRTGKEKILKDSKNEGGYLVVSLYKDGKMKKYYIHRLVAQAFIPNPNNYPIVNHKDEDKTNNRVANIEYCDSKYNNNYGTHNERVAKTLSIPIIQFTKNGEFIKRWDSIIQVERELGFANGNIGKCCKSKRKSAYGFVWMYAVINGFEIDINKLKKVA